MPALSEVLTLPPLRWILAAVKLAVVAILIWFLLHTGLMLFDGFTDELDNKDLKANVALVLADEVQPNGKPSPALKANLDKALQLYHEGRIESIIVSGTVDNAGHDQATLMGRYLFREGVPREMISVDSLSGSPLLTAANVKRMLEFHKTRRIIVVITGFAEIMRAKLAMGKCGFRVVYGAHANYIDWSNIWLAIPKEFAAYYFYLNQSCPDAAKS